MTMTIRRMWRSGCSMSALLTAAALGGCAILPAPAPQVDNLFGSSVRHSLAAQTARPDAGKRPLEPAQFDAQSAVAALAKHRESFKSPPPTFNVIGVTSGAQ
jgi:hypothetical protein